MRGTVPVETLRAWAYRRQGFDRDLPDALRALERVVAVYSSHPTAPLSLLARTASFDSSGFREIELAQKAIRLPAMRGSVFMVPTETAPQILSATRTPFKKLQGRLEYGGISFEDYERIRQQFVEVAITPKTTDELEELIPVDGKLMVAIRVLAYEGIALRIGTSLRSDAFTYVSAKSWLGGSLPEPEPDESLAWLASAYLRAFGPASTSDFAWWSGVTKTRARKAFEKLETVDLGDGLLLHNDDLEAFEDCPLLSGDEVAILPKWDAYTMGYPAESRSRFIDESDQPKAYPKVSATRGDGAPLILRGGAAVASWEHRFSGDRMKVNVTPFDPGDSLDWLSGRSFESVASMLDATDLTLIRGEN